MSQYERDLKTIVDTYGLERDMAAVRKRIRALEDKVALQGKEGRDRQLDALLTDGTLASMFGNGGGSGGGNGGGGGYGGGGNNPGGAGAGGGGTTVGNNPEDSDTDIGDDGADPFDNMKIGDTLNGASGLYDCDTGQALEVREDGLPVPPTGWDSISNDQTERPLDSTYATGHVWALLSGVDYLYSPTFSGLIAVRAGIDDSFPMIYLDGEGQPGTTPHVGDAVLFSSDPEGSGGTVYEYLANDVLVEPGHYSNVICSFYPGDEDACAIELPPAEWEQSTDEPAQLIKGTDGVLKPHVLDPNVPTRLQDGVTTLDFCYGDGQTGRREPVRGGGYMYYQTDEEGGTPIGNIKVFDFKNTLIKNDLKPDDIGLYRV